MTRYAWQHGDLHRIGRTTEYVWQCGHCSKMGGLNSERYDDDGDNIAATLYRLREHLVRRCPNSNLEPSEVERVIMPVRA